MWKSRIDINEVNNIILNKDDVNPEDVSEYLGEGASSITNYLRGYQLNLIMLRYLILELTKVRLLRHFHIILRIEFYHLI